MRTTVRIETRSRVCRRHRTLKASIGSRGRVVAWSRRRATASTDLLYGWVRRTSSVRSSGVANLKRAIGGGVIAIVVEEIISHAAQHGVFEARQEWNMMRGIVVAGKQSQSRDACDARIRSRACDLLDVMSRAIAIPDVGGVDAIVVKIVKGSA
jgi:hypothetical protein